MALEISSTVHGSVAVIELSGELDAGVAQRLRDETVAMAGHDGVRTVVFDMSELTFMASAGLRVLVFAKQKLGQGVELVIAGAQPAVAETIELTGFHHSVDMVETYDLDALGNA